MYTSKRLCHIPVLIAAYKTSRIKAQSKMVAVVSIITYKIKPDTYLRAKKYLQEV